MSSRYGTLYAIRLMRYLHPPAHLIPSFPRSLPPAHFELLTPRAFILEDADPLHFALYRPYTRDRARRFSRTRVSSRSSKPLVNTRLHARIYAFVQASLEMGGRGESRVEKRRADTRAVKVTPSLISSPGPQITAVKCICAR